MAPPHDPHNHSISAQEEPNAPPTRKVSIISTSLRERRQEKVNLVTKEKPTYPLPFYSPFFFSFATQQVEIRNQDASKEVDKKNGTKRGHMQKKGPPLFFFILREKKNQT
jgi:hypothetical protein